MERLAEGHVGYAMTRILLALGLLALASCAAETGPVPNPATSPGSATNPVTGTRGGGTK